jgi:hypothetical protein
VAASDDYQNGTGDQSGSTDATLANAAVMAWTADAVKIVPTAYATLTRQRGRTGSRPPLTAFT